ncbi:outer membrane protein assembly factor BamE [Pseudomonas sp. WJP1]|uniref:cell envelope protein SmpA n=1 Tax=Pseudomonas sp. WJP1 TaxID=2986947 RepID=UPI00234BC57F|nr:cell envelope protein SmpA [Pseudomonas sp. WJP1]WCM50262.1 outer membrane protein assembly factor BamE [Pseudomonas sp. WJP1]
MPSRISLLGLATLLYLALDASGATIHRCEAPDGRITFTTMSCAIDESLTHQKVNPYRPGTTITLVPQQHRETSSLKVDHRDPVVVGQAADKCGNLISASERRIAIINQRVIAGMSQQEVESTLGKPDKISIRNSSTRYHYQTKRGRSASIEFDERGCTKGKAKSQTAKSPL